MTEEKRYECETGEPDGGSEGQGGEERNELVLEILVFGLVYLAVSHRRKRADAPAWSS